MASRDKINNYFVLITADGPGVGKTTAAEYLSTELGVPFISTSSIIVHEIASYLKISIEDVIKKRAENPDNYREVLIAVGNKMTEDGRPPVIACFDNGYKIAEGARLAKEAVAAEKYAKTNEADYYHIHIIGDSFRENPVKDNTESNKLRKMAHYIISNESMTGMLVDLHHIANRIKKGIQHEFSVRET